MAHRVCPWWLGYWLICPLRRRGQNPAGILAPHVHEGMTALEPVRVWLLYTRSG